MAMVKKAKQPIYKKWWFWVIVVFLIIGAIGNALEEAEDNGKLAGVETEINNDLNNEDEQDVDKETNDVDESTTEADETEYEITGEMKVEIKDDKVVVTITTNAADGSIFETLVTDNQFNSVTDFISIENGVGTKEFDIPDEWDVGYLAGTAMMRFNLEDHPQPEHIRALYGEYGEKLTGDLAVENNLGGKNINITSEEIAYPDEETVESKRAELFASALEELVAASEGVIVDVQPYMPEEGWKIVKVIVSDAWYYSQEYEKERFAEQVAGAVTNVIKNAGIVEKDAHVSVYFYDTYGKELASPKLLGGYKIKR